MGTYVTNKCNENIFRSIISSWNSPSLCYKVLSISIINQVVLAEKSLFKKGQLSSCKKTKTYRPLHLSNSLNLPFFFQNKMHMCRILYLLDTFPTNSIMLQFLQLKQHHILVLWLFKLLLSLLCLCVVSRLTVTITTVLQGQLSKTQQFK